MNFFIVIIELVVGLVLILSGTIRVITADRTSRILTIHNGSLFKNSKMEIPFDEISAVQLEMNPSRNSQGLTYRIVAIREDGQSVPFRSYFTNGSATLSQRVNKLRAFLGVGGDDTGLGGTFQALSQLVGQKFQEEQETITGKEKERITDGVHWSLETRAFGATPISRWHSLDCHWDGSFLYLAQKPEGQKSQGGIIATMGKMLFKTSMSLFGFSGELTPNESGAKPLVLSDPQLANNFFAYTSDPEMADQILNPRAITLLVAWAQSQPLTKINPKDQLAVLFCPKGVFLATMGLTNPEFQDEVTKLGVGLVKTQDNTR